MGKLFRDLFSTTCNQHFELARVLTGVFGLGLVGLQVYAIMKGQSFSPSEFGIGAGTIVGGGAAGIAMKDRARTNAEVNVSVTNGE